MSRKNTQFMRIKVINVILYPTENQSPDKYTELFRKIHKNKVTVNTSTDRGTRFRTMFNAKDNNYDVLYGEMSNSIFINPDDNVLDNDTNEFVPHTNSRNTSYIPKEWPYYFFPDFHRFVFPSTLPESQIKKFLSIAINKYYETGEFSINVEKDTNIIQEIYKLSELTRLEATLHYSNNANNKRWRKAIDDELRKTNTNQAKFTFSGTRRHPITIQKESMVEGIIELSKSHGSAMARGYDAQGVIKNINTKEHPLVEQIEYDDNPFSAIISKIMNIINNNNNNDE